MAPLPTRGSRILNRTGDVIEGSYGPKSRAQMMDATRADRRIKLIGESRTPKMFLDELFGLTEPHASRETRFRAELYYSRPFVILYVRLR